MVRVGGGRLRRAHDLDRSRARQESGHRTRTHPSINEIGLEAYLKDIEDDEPLVRELEIRVHQHERFFRAPYLEEGDTEAERRGWCGRYRC
ncbi:MAG: hypothetical protein PHU25_05930 [Deltaproteobacteria bacterium]|nr:hypothetical protein [Deltaproteobacteria bacterium]